MKRVLSIFLMIFFPFLYSFSNGIRVNSYFQSHMVLQSDKPVIIWGESDSYKCFEVEFDNEVKTVYPDSEGKWSVEFQKRKASFRPITLRVDKQVFEDILIGDVWICSGQSNMFFQLSNSDYATKNIDSYSKELEKIRIVTYKGLRLVAKDGYTKEELQRCTTDNFFQHKWQLATINNLQDFSAVAIHFGIVLAQNRDVPIGLVSCSLGGSAINNWIPENVLRNDSLTSDWFKTDWFKNKKIYSAHIRRGKDAMQHVLPDNGEYIIDKLKYHFLCEPSFLFESSFKKIDKVSFKGVLWYQGESDTENEYFIERYAKFWRLLVDGWRENFRDDTLN